MVHKELKKVEREELNSKLPPTATSADTRQKWEQPPTERTVPLIELDSNFSLPAQSLEERNESSQSCQTNETTRTRRPESAEAPTSRNHSRNGTTKKRAAKSQMEQKNSQKSASLSAVCRNGRPVMDWIPQQTQAQRRSENEIYVAPNPYPYGGDVAAVSPMGITSPPLGQGYRRQRKRRKNVISEAADLSSVEGVQLDGERASYGRRRTVTPSIKRAWRTPSRETRPPFFEPRHDSMAIALNSPQDESFSFGASKWESTESEEERMSSNYPMYHGYDNYYHEIYHQQMSVNYTADAQTFESYPPPQMYPNYAPEQIMYPNYPPAHMYPTSDQMYPIYEYEYPATPMHPTYPNYPPREEMYPDNPPPSAESDPDDSAVPYENDGVLWNSTTERESPHQPPTTNMNRCIRLESVPSRPPDISQPISLPEFHHLVNFPDCCFLGDQHSRPCVMCGEDCRVVRSRREGENTQANLPYTTAHSFKGICSFCVESVWKVRVSGVLIKYCGSCFQFRQWGTLSGQSPSERICVFCCIRAKA